MIKISFNNGVEYINQNKNCEVQYTRGHYWLKVKIMNPNNSNITTDLTVHYNAKSITIDEDLTISDIKYI